MLDFDIREDTEPVEKQLTRLERKQVPFAKAVAMTNSAKDGQEFFQDTMKRKLDRPRRFTINSVRVKPASKRDLEAHVWIRDEALKGTPPIKYLEPLIYGRSRNPKRHEKALRRMGILPAGWYTVPGDGARLNRFGNLTSGMYTKILSDLRASPDPLQNRASGRKARFFVLRKGRTPLGIYERRSKNRIASILHFVRRAPTYRPILPFDETVDEVARAHFRWHFNRALTHAIRTMKV